MDGYFISTFVANRVSGNSCIFGKQIEQHTSFLISSCRVFVDKVEERRLNPKCKGFTHWSAKCFSSLKLPKIIEIFKYQNN